MSGTSRTEIEARVVEIEQRVDAVLRLVRHEVLRAALKHKPINSPHEGWAVLREEVDELWDEVKADRGRELSALEEATHVAAMGVRYILDLGFDAIPAQVEAVDKTGLPWVQGKAHQSEGMRFVGMTLASLRKNET